MSELATQAVRGTTLFVRRFEVLVTAGVDVGKRVASEGEELTIGTAEGNDLRLTDPAASRHHCVLRTHERGLEVRDLASRNATMVGPHVEITRGFLATGARLVLGATTIEVRVLDEEIAQPLAPTDTFGQLLGGSPPMRRMYALLQSYASSSATVLVHGETGTGKELVADAIHEASSRRHRPFVTVDCGALSHELAESELFGHERGAFTGADVAREGAFEAAHGGTIFLDEIGELSLDLQPKLLRVLESKTTRRVGATAYKPVDVRVIVATHRDLRVAINEKRFRADLFYRINVLRVEVPALRDRKDDIRLLATRFWSRFRPDQVPPPLVLDQLASQDWPGNVRELRNTVERAALVGWTPDLAMGPTTYQDAKARAIAEWERGWVEELLRSHAHNLSQAARAAQVGRATLRTLARRYGLRDVVEETSGDDA